MQYALPELGYGYDAAARLAKVRKTDIGL